MGIGAHVGMHHLIERNTSDAVRITLDSVLKPASTITLQACEVPLVEKPTALRQLLCEENGKTLVFTRTKHGAERLARNLAREGFSAIMIHGDRTQSQRMAALSGFVDGRYQILVATDVAARGLDIDDVAHVINYDLPSIPEDFIHRVGRTGRAGNTGRATSLLSGADIIELNRFEKVLKLKIARKRYVRSEQPLVPPAHHKMPIPIDVGRQMHSAGANQGRPGANQGRPGSRRGRAAQATVPSGKRTSRRRSTASHSRQNSMQHMPGEIFA